MSVDGTNTAPPVRAPDYNHSLQSTAKPKHHPGQSLLGSYIGALANKRLRIDGWWLDLQMQLYRYN